MIYRFNACELDPDPYTFQHSREATLNHAMMAARKATGDDGHQQRTMQTQRRRGYRFVAAIEAMERPTY
jgi:DNA-binding winged helix-turn-helix (wHTH) protein